jgi:hypothetical protein
MAETFICIHSCNGHLIAKVGGCVKVRKRSVEGIYRECFNGFVTEVGGDGLTTANVPRSFVLVV